MIRYNLLTKFFIKDNLLIISNPTHTKKLKIWYEKRFYNFLVFCENKIFITYKDIQKYNIPQWFIKILLHFNFLTKEKNNWWEAIFYNEIEENPSKTLNTLSKKEINILYKNIEIGIGEFIDNWYQKIYQDIKELKIKIDETALSQLHSERLEEDKWIFKQEDMISMIKTIFWKRKKEKLFNIQRSFFKFWSGGGLYSIFPIIITKNNDVIIYDHFNENFFIKRKQGIYDDFIKNVLIPCSINFSAYNYFVILTSQYTNVYHKYGNRWYRLLLLESWEISFMVRLLCWAKNKSHVEIQWFFDQELQNILDKGMNLLCTDRLLPLHILAVSD